jgi:hypothetical protein
MLFLFFPFRSNFHCDWVHTDFWFKCVSVEDIMLVAVKHPQRNGIDDHDDDDCLLKRLP